MNPKNIILLIAAILFLFGLLSLTNNSNSYRPAQTDGVFESAIEKIESGRALDDREMQRVDDILRWKNRD